jgi:hypothetical protein
MAERKPCVDDRHTFAPVPQDEAQEIEVPRRPSIKTPPDHTPLEPELSARIATVQLDSVSAGDPALDGVIVMSDPLEHRGDRRVHRPAPRTGLPQAHKGGAWTLPTVRDELESGADAITVRIDESGEAFTVTPISPRRSVRSF